MKVLGDVGNAVAGTKEEHIIPCLERTIAVRNDHFTIAQNPYDEDAGRKGNVLQGLATVRHIMAHFELHKAHGTAGVVFYVKSGRCLEHVHNFVSCYHFWVDDEINA